MKFRYVHICQVKSGQSQRSHIVCDSIYMQVQNRQIYGDRKIRAGGRGEMEVTAKGCGLLLGMMTMFYD